MDKVRLVVELDKETHRKLKVKTATEGTSMSAILVKCAKEYIGIPPDRTTEDRETYDAGKR